MFGKIAICLLLFLPCPSCWSRAVAVTVVTALPEIPAKECRCGKKHSSRASRLAPPVPSDERPKDPPCDCDESEASLPPAAVGAILDAECFEFGCVHVDLSVSEPVTPVSLAPCPRAASLGFGRIVRLRC